LQKSGLEETTSQEAPPENAPTPQQCTSPTAAYKLQKDKLQRLPPQPFEKPLIPTLVDSSSNELATQPQQIAEDSQASSSVHTNSNPQKQIFSPQKNTTDSETEIPTPKLRSRRARPIRVKQYPDMIYY